MINRSIILVLIGIYLAAGSGFTARQAAGRRTPLAFTVPAGWPRPVYDFKSNPLTQEGVELGRRLFYDGRLSLDGQFACASCHQQFAAFATFDHSLSHGYNNSLTTRNAPGLFNLAWQKELMQDGGINHLDLQPLAPLTAPNEMAEEINHVLQKLRNEASYRRLFTAAFGDTAINTRRLTQALSQFLLTLVSANSRYDQVMRGEASFNLPESLGYKIFRQKCSNCHREPLMTDYSYRNVGLEIDSFIRDNGRMRITRNVADSIKFKVPSLRNVAVTAPYGHDGRFFSLYDVLDHYRKPAPAGGTTDSLLQKGIPLSNYEIGQLTAFLYTLTDSAFLRNRQLAMPADLLLPPAPDADRHLLPRQ